ncbi:carboxypeptidase-like regulatory domain-containing protein [Rubinisphaera margarita]|uniref:carboxypeptidase-like regulatory domain-containing protein n=1 Tax=Rubinisphaera margarita TaxID=2909586 RepID=UPI001EE9102E|nr:carboxypeptidase-like regulatory domain-containing protein [Rubinisphaera margarita]MCG6155817.1 carboxypeptidase-like regulatory domain-containing protein [Rubinisphaera margarita]
MKRFNLITKSMVGLACLGMAMPQAPAFAGPATQQMAAKVQIADVALNNGMLSGKVVDAQGQVISGAVVKASLNNQTVSTAVSNANGEFQLSSLNTGMYQVSSGESQAAVRVWEGAAAPPAAKSGLLLVNGQTALGQDCCDDGCTGYGGRTGLGIAAIVAVGAATAIAITAAQDDDDDAVIVSP